MSESNIEKFKYGNINLTPEEEEKARIEGNLEEKRKKMEKATAALHAIHSNKAIKEFEDKRKKEK